MIQDVAGEKALTVRIAPEVYRRLEELAKREKRSVSAQAAYLIEHGLRSTLITEQVQDLGKAFTRGSHGEG